MDLYETELRISEINEYLIELHMHVLCEKSCRQLDHSSSSLKNLPTIDPRISFSIFSGQQREKTFNHYIISYSNKMYIKKH